MCRCATVCVHFFSVGYVKTEGGREGGRVRVWMGFKGSTVNMGCFNMRPWDHGPWHHTTGKCPRTLLGRMTDLMLFASFLRNDSSSPEGRCW
jgi:hypothetical protein